MPTTTAGAGNAVDAGCRHLARVATAVDAKKAAYYVYITQMKDKIGLHRAVPGEVLQLSLQGRDPPLRDRARDHSSLNGLIGGVAQNDVKKLVLTGGSKKMTIPLTTDNGYLWGCPGAENCAKWVRTVLGYNAARASSSPAKSVQ